MQDGVGRRMVANQKAVGVFDSGVGGLSVLHALRRELPYEHFLYVGDSGCAPYGDRSAEFVVDRAITITEFLISERAKAVVVACNTATAVAVESLRRRFEIPIVAIEPAIKPAASRTRSRVVGVLATTGTLSSPNIGKLLASYGGLRQSSGEPRHSEAKAGSDVEIVIQPCPGLADQVEKGELASIETRALVKRYVRPIIDKGGDVIVLGCTHYPFLRPLIQEVAGPAVEVIDPATPVARELRRRLESGGLTNDSTEPGTERFWTTGAVEIVGPIVRQLWGTMAVVSSLRRNTECG
jgi:glutamate racemase